MCIAREWDLVRGGLNVSCLPRRAAEEEEEEEEEEEGVKGGWGGSGVGWDWHQTWHHKRNGGAGTITKS